jgi:hypothetical protein
MGIVFLLLSESENICSTGGSHIPKTGNMPSEMGTAIEKQLKEWMF